MILMLTDYPKGRHTRPVAGFTIVEMLGVLFVAGVILAITFPTISALSSGSRAEAGINTASVAVDVSRAWATNGLPPIDVTSLETYSGTAAIFSPAREIRIVTEDLDATNTGGARLASAGTLDGYEDRPGLDYVTVPSGVGYVGVRRNGGTLELLPAPFAIAFTENGQLKLDTELIVYDGDQDGAYDTTDVRPGGYTPADADRDSVTPDTTTGKRNLPFEVIETASAVIAFDLNEFYDEFGTGAWSPSDNSANGRNEWIRENGRVLLFSPMTGIAFRDEAL